MADQFLADLMGDWGDPEETPAAPFQPDTDVPMTTEELAEILPKIASPIPVDDKPQFPTLYHKGSDGSTRQWRVWTDGAKICREHGIIGGQMQLSIEIAEPKNVGRANATTAEQQAVMEAQALWTHKVERKYRQDINDAQETIFLPMLAKKYEPKKHNKKLQWPVDVQPKLDGVRCIAYWDEDGTVKLMSRQGKEYSVPAHINKQLALFLPKDAITDGELYIHGVPLQTLNKYIKKLRPETAKVEYHIYDVPQWNGVDDQPWSERGKWLQELRQLLPFNAATKIHIVETGQAFDEPHVVQWQKSFILVGYEGAIIRNPTGVYKWGLQRSDDLLKVKTFQDAEFTVVGHEVETKTGTDSDGDYSYNCVVWVCETADGKRFNCRPKGSLQMRQEMLAQAAQYVGKKLTVRFFDLTEDGIPRFPVGVAFRLDEDLP
jgi:hypothetical protein